MNRPCFTTTTTIRGSVFQGTCLKQSIDSKPKTKFLSVNQTIRSELNLIPGVPPGEDARDNAPLRNYVPRPIETYDDRSFSTILPRTWEGEINSIGVSDITPETNKSKEIEVTIESTGAFVDYARMVKEEREQALEEQKKRSSLGYTGRATCGETEGKAFVSNYRPILTEGVKVVEYWGVANGPVPRLFGGPTA